jgi:hypothetical protein
MLPTTYDISILFGAFERKGAVVGHKGGGE